MRIIEQKCARLMTLLKPSYLRARLDMPPPPASKGLSQYPLDPTKIVLSADQYEERWTTAVLRARKQCKKILSARSQFILSGGQPVGQQVRNRADFEGFYGVMAGTIAVNRRIA